MLRRNVLIFHLGALGDFVMTWPLAMALGRLYPQSRIIYVTHGQKGALAERVLRVDSVDVEGGWHRLFAPDPELSDSVRKSIEGAHCIITFVARSNETWIRNVRATESRADLIPLEPRPPEDYPGHFTDFWIEQLGPWAAMQASAIAMIRSVSSRGIVTSTTRTDTIYLHPGSGGSHKCWPASSFLRLIELLREQAKPVRVILGEVELQKWPAEQIRQFESASEIVQPANLVELFEHLASAAAVVVNDSGPAHVAAMIGTPSLVLFGPSNPVVWRPVGPKVEILHQNPLASIQPADVYDRLLPLL